jgi:hypothetical protein
MARVCIFCPNESADSREHLWSAWIGRLFPSSPGFKIKRQTPDGEASEWTLPELDVKARFVCESCNTGWMSKIESRVGPILGPMILRGMPTLLTPEQIKHVAEFSFKSAIVGSHINGNENDPFFPKPVRENFRLSLHIPFGVQMWMASYYGRNLHGTFDSRYLHPAFGILAEAEFHSFTFSVGHFAIQVLTGRWRERIRRNELPPILTPDPVWMPAVIKLWPYHGESIAWPPEKDLNAKSFDVFKKRWQANVKYSF